MKRFLSKLLAFALVAGLAALALVPVIVGQYRLWQDGKAVRAYLDAARGLTLLDCGTLLAQARDYDAARGGIRWADPFAQGDAPAADGLYAAALNPFGDGVMCVLEVPKLGLLAPVGHGQSGVDGSRVAHLPGSSLPLGDPDGQCALVAARGGWLSGPFAALDRLMPGDCFYLYTLQDTLVYEVSQVTEVAPEALAEPPAMEDGDSQCVLMTTAPYGSDARRLMVIGRRASRRDVMPAEDTRPVPGWATRLILALPVAVVGLLVLAIVEGLRRAARRRMRRRMRL